MVNNSIGFVPPKVADLPNEGRIGDIVDQCYRSLPRYQESISRLTYVPNSILFWEGLVFCALLDLFKVDVVIESGVAGGGSTRIWAEYFRGQIYAIDDARYYGRSRFEATRRELANYENVALIQGDAFLCLLPIIRKHAGSTIAICIDGPKGRDAILLAKRCFNFPQVKFVAIHDQAKPVNYHQMDSWDKTAFYTDADSIVDRFSFLDYERSSEELREQLRRCPKGYGLGFAMNSTKGSGLQLSDRILFELRVLKAFARRISPLPE